MYARVWETGAALLALLTRSTRIPASPHAYARTGPRRYTCGPTPNYSVALRPNPLKKDEPAKAYATAQVNGELSLKQLSRRVSMQTTVSRADVVAVLISTVENLLDALQEGKQVDFGELGKFRLQILNEGAESLEKFTSANITGVNIQYIPGEDLKNIFAGLEFQPVASRKVQQAVLRAEKAGETSVDISKKPASGGDDSESPDEI